MAHVGISPAARAMTRGLWTVACFYSENQDANFMPYQGMPGHHLGRYIVASTSISAPSPGMKRDTSTTVLAGGSPG